MYYNYIKRCDDCIDSSACEGDFNDIFKGILYGYYYNYNQCGEKPSLKFTLYFAHPLDPAVSTDCVKDELNGFKNHQPKDFCTPTKNMLPILLQYDDYYTMGEKTHPQFLEAITNNIYYNIYGNIRGIIKKYIGGDYTHQIQEIVDRTLLYKVTFDIPFDVIADYINVDKILIRDTKELTKNIYKPSDSINKVENVYRKLTRMKSLMEELGILISEIRSNPDKYKMPHEYKLTNTPYDDFWKKYHEDDQRKRRTGYNIENADILFKRAKVDFENMVKVLYQLREVDIKVEPDEILLTDQKCSHDLCTRPKNGGSEYCDQCIQLPTRECNFCQKKD